MKAKRGDMREEYDFSKGQRGRYSARFADGSNVVVLAPDVADAFTEQQVNEVLREALRRRESGGDG